MILGETIRELGKKHGQRLRPKMSYNRFTNLGEMLNSDLSGKVMMNSMTKKEKTENAITNLDRNARMASVCTEATAARSMLSTNSKIASLAKATSVKHNNSSKRELLIILQKSGNVPRLQQNLQER